MWQDYMARRTCFREQYYTGTRGYITAREDCRPIPGETIYVFVMVFHEYLRIGQFFWALVLCGTRYYQSASVDCSGTIQKIHVSKIQWHQGAARAYIMMDLMILGHLTRPRGPFRARGSALTRNVARLHGSKNLLQRAILYRHNMIYHSPGRLQANTRGNYICFCDGFP